MPKHLLRTLLLGLLPTLLVSCAGYQLGGHKPSHLAHVRSIQVPLFVNDTQIVRADTHATNSAIDALTRDGTYQIGSAESAEAILKGTVKSADYRQVSASRTDTLKSEELSMEITIEWVLVDSANPANILASGSSKGKTRFSAGDNLEIARTNALSDALRRASEAMTTRIADGF